MSELRPKVDSHVVFERILERLDDGIEAEVRLTTGVESLTRFANSFIHQNVAESGTAVRLRLHVDGRTAAGS